MRVWIPGGNNRARFHGRVVFHLDSRAVRQLVTLALAAILVGQSQLTGTGYRYQFAVLTLYYFHVEQANGARHFHLDIINRRRPRCRTTNVEGTHGQLCARLTDGLRSNNTHSLTGVDLVSTRQVTTVTLGANAIAGLTGNRRAHNHFVNTHSFKALDPFLVDHGAGRNGNFVAARLHNINGNNTSEDTITERFDNVAAFNHRCHQQAFSGATVRLSHYQILGNVYQAACQVTGVCRFQCGISQPLTSTVR